MQADEDPIETPAAAEPRPARSAIKSLFALVLAWIGWVMIVIAVMLFVSGELSLALMGFVFLAVGCGLGFAVRALTPAWYRLFTVVATAYGVLSLAMAAISIARSGASPPDQILRGIVSIAGAVGLAIGGWIARRRARVHS